MVHVGKSTIHGCYRVWCKYCQFWVETVWRMATTASPSLVVGNHRFILCLRALLMAVKACTPFGKAWESPWVMSENSEDPVPGGKCVRVFSGLQKRQLPCCTSREREFRKCLRFGCLLPQEILKYPHPSLRRPNEAVPLGEMFFSGKKKPSPSPWKQTQGSFSN